MTNTCPSSVIADAPSARVNGFASGTVWHVFTPLAQRLGAINLGQGFPDWAPPPFAVEAAIRAVSTPALQQYARSQGHLPLCQAIVELYAEALPGLDPNSQVVVTNGCTEALFSSLMGLVDPGDQVIVLEPFFDMYEPQIRLAGGETVGVALECVNERWVLNIASLEKAITEKSKVLLLNTPHNPTGLVLDREHLEGVADIVRRFPRLVVLSDEVYEHIRFIGGEDHRKCTHFASLPGMFERTMTLSSAGKTFSLTGWKVGWVVGPDHLLKSTVQAVHQFVCFSVNTPLQEAVAHALREAENPYEGFQSYYAYLRSVYEGKRARLVVALQAAGLSPIVPDGSFFIVASTENIRLPEKYEAQIDDDTVTRDWAMCLFLAHEIGVVAIPMSPFCSKSNVKRVRHLVRFAFCKKDDLIDEAARRLLRLKEFAK